MKPRKKSGPIVKRKLDTPPVKITEVGETVVFEEEFLPTDKNIKPKKQITSVKSTNKRSK